MRCFSILFFGILHFYNYQICFGSKCVPNPRVDISKLLPNVFQEALKSVPVPTVEIGDEDAMAKFGKNYTKHIAYYTKSLLINLHDQAVFGGEKLVEDIEKYSNKIEESIKSIAHNSTKLFCLDDDLKLLIYQLWKFLELKPGNAKIKDPVLRDLPGKQVDFIPLTRSRTAEELFLAYIPIIHNYAAGIYEYFTAIYLTAWKHVRAFYKALQAQFRYEILNGPVMEAYKLAVVKVFKNRQLIENYVETETWYSFEKAGNRVISIYNDYQLASKNKKDC